MDKELIQAVAGSGKTRLLVERLNEQDRFLLLTYTENNYVNLRGRIIEKFGFMPENIHLQTYFQFLYSFCIRPLLGDQLSCKGIDWDSQPRRFAKKSDQDYFFTKGNYLYHNRIALLLEARESMPHVKERLSKYFDSIFIDEIQDFGGHDLNFVCSLADMNVAMLLVGDFYQHTFDTSKDGNVNRNIYDNLGKFLKKLEGAGYKSDLNLLARSYRCSPTVCQFICDNLGVRIESHRQDTTEINVIEDVETTEQVFKNHEIVKLFYQEHHKYPCRSENWGKSKGQDHYQDVCIVLNPNSLKAFEASRLNALPPMTKSKLYVACTRTRGNLYFVSSSLVNKFKEQ